MAPAQGPTLSGKTEKTTFNNTNSEKKNGKKTRRKAIALDPLSLTFLTTRCKHDGKEDECFKRNTQVDVDFFSAVLESVKPAVFFALDTKVWIEVELCFTFIKYFKIILRFVVSFSISVCNFHSDSFLTDSTQRNRHPIIQDSGVSPTSVSLICIIV